MNQKFYHTEQELWAAFLSSDNNAFACIFTSSNTVFNATFIALKRTWINHQKKILNNHFESIDEIPFNIELSTQNSEVDDIFYDEEMRSKLATALDQLSERQKEAIYLYYIQEIPLNEVQSLLGMNYQSTRNLIHRAITKLRQTIKLTSLLCIFPSLYQLP